MVVTSNVTLEQPEAPLDADPNVTLLPSGVTLCPNDVTLVCWVSRRTSPPHVTLPG